MTEKKGYSDINQFRQTNDYQETQKLFEKLGLDKVGDRTPTVGVNIAHLATMTSVNKKLKEKVSGQDINIAILGLTTPQGPKDLEKLLKALGANFISTTTIDLSDGSFEEIEKTGLDQVTCLQCDARDTGLASESQDIVLLDHLGNCCPPAIDQAINSEVKRILKPRGSALVNITTSELLSLSDKRQVINLDQLTTTLSNHGISLLVKEVYDLEDLGRQFPHLDINSFRGPMLEIEPASFVIFGEDPQGHGEWFRSQQDHLIMWQQNGFNVSEIKSRVGWDSHNPPLRCFRHNVVLTKP